MFQRCERDVQCGRETLVGIRNMKTHERIEKKVVDAYYITEVARYICNRDLRLEAGGATEIK